MSAVHRILEVMKPDTSYTIKDLTEATRASDHVVRYACKQLVKGGVLTEAGLDGVTKAKNYKSAQKKLFR